MQTLTHPLSGATILGIQSGPLSDNAHSLLGYLNTKPWGTKTCIGEHNGKPCFIPSPSFNWDGRYDVQAMRVLHPECVQELVDHGYLSFAEYEAANWSADYATVWQGHMNRVFTLTEEGEKFLAN